ncbi:MAG TPA: hypothetical protein VG755_43390 [Nannocystaceae bacterium]|nr:hypothetical protein [Nannocystaceae bacterium]
MAFATALAPSPATEIAWDAPAECPDATHVRRTIEHYAARGLDETGAVLPSASGAIAAEPGGYRLRLHMEVGDGSATDRVLDDPSCEVLAETAALMIAVTIDPTAVTRPPPPKVEPTPPPVEPAPPKQVEPAVVTPPVVTPAKRSCDVGPSRLRSGDLRPCGAIEAYAGAQLGILPQTIGGGVGGTIAITWARLRLELGGSHWFRRTARTDDARGELGLSAGSASACARLGRRRFELPLCAGAEVGAIHGRGLGISEPKTERVLWAAAVLGPRAMWVVHPRLALLFGADLVVPFARYRFEIAGIGVIHRVEPVGGRFRLGLGVRI